ncbi:MAG: RidA family protein [Gemmatimonadetes bacterium]|nr:RidA family protein [Gemmatimonadota bacterium]
MDDTSYSDVVTVSGDGQLIHVAGQLAFDDDRRVVGDDVKTMARRCLDRIEAHLGRVGAGLPHVVRITTLLVNLEDYPPSTPCRPSGSASTGPPSTAYQVAGLLFGALVEIGAVAFLPGPNEGGRQGDRLSR